MAGFLQKIRVKTATEGTWNRTMKGQHDTTLNIGQFGILKAKFLEAGHGYIEPWTFSNMEPLPQPTWGEIKYESRIFVVPMSLIFKGYNDFKEDTIHANANNGATSLTTLPNATNGEMVEAIRSLMDIGTQADYDKCIYYNGQAEYYNHTPISYRSLRLLESLGYKLRWARDQAIPVFNICRILAVAKVYLDYYYNNGYIGDTQYNAVKCLFERDNGNLTYDAADLRILLGLCQDTYYNPDYFTSCWDNPNHPNLSNQESVYTLNDPNNPITGAISANQKITNSTLRTTGGDPALIADETSGRATNLTGITQLALTKLRSLTMFLKRNQLAGGEALTRMLARYGYAPLTETIKKAREIGKVTWGMNVTPIFSNADTVNGSAGEQLGSYAGFAWAQSGEKGKHHFEFECKEDSILVETIAIAPVETYTQGIDAENLVLTRLELPTPEFDNVGVEMVKKCELLTGEQHGEPANDQTTMYTTGFGFLPRYAKFKFMRDTLSGNFTQRTWEAMYKGWTMQRYFDPSTFDSSNTVHSKDFTRQMDAEQYQRIFYAVDTGKHQFDYFRLHHELKIEWWSYLKPAYDYYDWEHEGGKQIEIQNNGPVAN